MFNGGWGYVLDYFLAGISNFLESLLVATSPSQETVQHITPHKADVVTFGQHQASCFPRFPVFMLS